MCPSTVLQTHMAKIFQLKRLFIAQPEQGRHPPETDLGIECGKRMLIANTIKILLIIIPIALLKNKFKLI